MLVSSAIDVMWRQEKTYEVFGSGIASGAAARNIGNNLHVCPLGSGTGAIDHAAVWAGTITVDLVESHHDHTTLGDLWHVSTVGSEHLRNLSSWVVVTTTKGLSAGIGSGVLESGGILLEWVSSGSITRGGGVN